MTDGLGNQHYFSCEVFGAVTRRTGTTPNACKYNLSLRWPTLDKQG
jgi:hypothetical protein